MMIVSLINRQGDRFPSLTRARVQGRTHTHTSASRYSINVFTIVK